MILTTPGTGTVVTLDPSSLLTSVSMVLLTMWSTAIGSDLIAMLRLSLLAVGLHGNIIGEFWNGEVNDALTWTAGGLQAQSFSKGIFPRYWTAG